MKDRCGIFNLRKHKLPRGYYGDAPYLRKGRQVVDGMGTIHVDLLADCDRCGKEFTVGRMHLTKGYIGGLKND